jgi:hypothetical protein
LGIIFLSRALLGAPLSLLRWASTSASPFFVYGVARFCGVAFSCVAGSLGVARQKARLARFFEHHG